MSDDPHLRVTLAGPYQFGMVERVIRDLTALFNLEDPAIVELDMTRLTFISPAALALLTAALRRVEDLDLSLPSSVVRLPRAEGVSRYLWRMNFLKLLSYGQLTEEPFERKQAVGFRECAHFDSAENYPGVRKDLADAISERCKTDDVSRNSLHVALDEIFENVLFHAETEHGGFAVAQALKTKPLMEIAVADVGIGIRASLTKNPAYRHVTDDVTAIATALMPKVTSTPERNSGFGLFVTTLLLVSNGGELLVRSGTGAVFRGSRRSEVERPNPLPGTLVVLRIRTDRGLDINEVYRALERAIKDLGVNAEHRGDDADATR